MRANLAALVLVLAVTAVTAGCGGSEQVVRLGVLTDCQGPFHPFEDAALAAAELPFIRRGAAPAGPGPTDGVTAVRVGGRRVELVRGCQEAGEHTVFIENARRLVETEHVDAIVGGASVVARDLARRYPEVPFVSTVWSEQEVTLRRPASNLFRFSPDYGQDAAGLGTYAYRKLGWRRAAIVAGDESSGWNGAAAFTAEFCALGGRVVEASYRSPYTGEPDVVARALATRPDGVAAFLTAFDDQATVLARLATTLGDPSRLVTWGPSVEDANLLHALGPKLDGVVTTTWLPTRPSPALRRYRELYHASFAGLPSSLGDQSWALGYYDALEALLSALERVEGSNVRAGLLLALRQGDVELPDGRVTLDANRQAVRDGYLARVMWRDGKSALVPLAIVPKVEQTYGGLLSEAPPPGPGTQPCVKGRPPAWAR